MVHASPLLPPKQHTHKKKSHSLSLYLCLSLLFHSFCWVSFLAFTDQRFHLSLSLSFFQLPTTQKPFLLWYSYSSSTYGTTPIALGTTLLFHILTCLALKQNKTPVSLTHYCVFIAFLSFVYFFCTHTHTLTSFLCSTPPPPFANKTPTQNQNHFPLSFSL